MRDLFKKLYAQTDGGVTVETSLTIMLLIILTGGSIEAGYAFYQYNGAQQAVRTGARIAATSDPVARDMATITGLTNGTTQGQAFPNYEYICQDDTKRCSEGSFDARAMQRIIYGPDEDGICGATSSPRRGMCDVFKDTSRAKVEVSYFSSGLGKAGYIGDSAPLISVTLREVPLNFVFLDIIGFQNLLHLPPVEATLMGEDLKNG